MKLNAIGIVSSDFQKSVTFYKILGFEFPAEITDGHFEAITKEGSARLMLDSPEMIKGIYGYEPKHSNHSNFAISYDSATEINNVAKMLKQNNFTIYKEPWDAFWGQRYCVVQDPDGQYIDLYAPLQ